MQQVQFIKQAQALGLTLDDIQQLVTGQLASKPCAIVPKGSRPVDTADRRHRRPYKETSSFC